MNPHLIINKAVSNIICHLVFGHRFEYGDKKFVKLMLLFDKALHIEASIWAQVLCFKVVNEMLRLPVKTEYMQHIPVSSNDYTSGSMLLLRICKCTCCKYAQSCK